MSAFLRCSHCEKYCTAEDRLIGKKVRCPACGEVGLIKAQDGATAAYPSRTEGRTKVLRPKPQKEHADEPIRHRDGVPIWMWPVGGSALVGIIAMLALAILLARGRARSSAPGSPLPMIEPPSMTAYLAERPANPARFRVRARLSDRYASYDQASYYSIELHEVDDFNWLCGYISRDSSAGQRLFALLQDGQLHSLRVVVRLTGPKGRKAEGSEVLIESFEETSVR